VTRYGRKGRIRSSDYRVIIGMSVFNGAPAQLRLISLLALTVVQLWSVACGGGSSEPAVSPTSTISAPAANSDAGEGISEGEAPRAVVPKPAGLKDLQGVEDLRVLFNQAEGVPRIVLLVSPT